LGPQRSILVVNWVSSCLSFFLSASTASTAATYTLATPTCTSTIISLESCALNTKFQHFILSWSISYWDLIKCLYFVDTTERVDRGWKEAQRQGEDRLAFRITLTSEEFSLGWKSRRGGLEIINPQLQANAFLANLISRGLKPRWAPWKVFVQHRVVENYRPWHWVWWKPDANRILMTKLLLYLKLWVLLIKSFIHWN
jgi:hypothetical protein